MLREILNNKKNVILAAGSMLLVGLLAVGGTVAYYKSLSSSVTNTFTIGIVTTKIEEEVDSEGTKEPYITNTGKSDCIVRMRYAITPSDANNEVSINNGNGDKGVNNGWIGPDKKGFYYYQGVLKGSDNKTGNKTDTPLFSKYVVNQDYRNKDKFIPFEIILYQEAVQAEATIEGKKVCALNEDGTFNEVGAKEIWKAYDERLLVEATSD